MIMNVNKIILEIRAGAGGDQKKSDRYFCQKKQKKQNYE